MIVRRQVKKPMLGLRRYFRHISSRERGKTMRTFESLRDALYYRMTENPDHYFTDALWEEEVNFACTVLPKTIRFLRVECTDQELWCLGEVFDDIMEKTNSAEFLRVLRERAGKVTDPQQKEEIMNDICTAATFLQDK